MEIEEAHKHNDAIQHENFRNSIETFYKILEIKERSSGIKDTM